MSKKINNRFRRTLATVLVAGLIVTSVMPVSAVTTETNSTQTTSQGSVVAKTGTGLEADAGFEIFDKVDAEPLAGAGDPLNGFKAVQGKVEVSNDMNNTPNGGVASMKFSPISDANHRYETVKSYDSAISGAKVSVDFYDNGEANQKLVMLVDSGTKVNSPAEQVFIGINNGYFYRSKTKISKDDGGTDVQVNSTVARTKGWHTFTVDYTDTTKVSFYIDDELMGEIETPNGSDFAKVSFVNFWADDMGEKHTYADNFLIQKLKPLPSNLVADDEKNTVDWDNFGDFTAVKDYEYTTDGGSTWKVCESKPVVLPNANIGANQVGIRVKSPSSDTSYEAVYVDQEFTYSINRVSMFENSSDISEFKPRYTTGIDMDSKYSRSGLYSMKISSEETTQGGNYQFEANLPLSEAQNNKVLSIWFYDTMNTKNSVLVTPYVNSTGNADKLGIGTSNGKTYDGRKGTEYYYIRDFDGKKEIVTEVSRAEGWHQFTWDYTGGTDCKMYIDGKLVHTGEADGFDKVSIIDYWSQSKHSVYFDDFQIVDSMEDLLDVAKAPTAPVTNDIEKTFGFTPVAGKEDISLYEYSVDNGKTFSQVTANPQEVPNLGLKAGEVMVRLKAVDGGVAGQVLRSTVDFTQPDAVYRTPLEKLYNHALGYYVADYTEESWTEAKLSDALNKAKSSLDNRENYQSAMENLQKAVDTLVLDLNDYTFYDFEGAEDAKVLPFHIISGKLDWSEYGNISGYGKQAYKLLTEDVDGKQIARVQYNFADVLDNKYLSMIFRDTKAGATHIRVMNSETNCGIHFYGASDGYYYALITDGVEGPAMKPGFRRNDDWYNAEFNFTLSDALKFTLDTRKGVTTDLFSSFDSIDITYEDSKAGFLTVENFMIREENPITKMTPKDTDVTLGYYETYEFNINNVVYETEKDYKTTDFITYTTSDSSVANVTTDGSIEHMGVGTAVITATTSTGLKETINVTCEDVKVQKVDISTSDYNDVPVYEDSINMQPSYKKVLMAIMTPSNVTNRTIIWKSSDESVATVNAGEVTALKEGTAIITATSQENDEILDKITINVAKEDLSDRTIQVFVATDGDDYAGLGTIEKPFATLTRARDEVRTLQAILGTGAVINVRGGKYTILNGFEFEAQDSGFENAPIEYKAYNDEEVQFVGTIDFSSKDLSKVDTSSEAYKKLPDVSKDKVYVYDMSEFLTEHKDIQYVGHSMGNVPWLAEEGYNTTDPYYTLTVNGQAQTLSRWPNIGENVYSESYLSYTKIDKIINPGANPRMWKDDVKSSPDWVPPEKRDKYDTFEVASNKLSERMDNWYGVPRDGTNILDLDIYMSGYWKADFSDQTAQIRYITGNNIKSDVPSGYSVANSKAANRFYVYNIMQELDIPGEWYLDQTDYKLYMYLENGLSSNDDAQIQMAVLEDNMFTFNDCSNITIDGIDVQGVLGNAISITGTNNVKIENLTVSSTGLKAANVGSSKTNIVKNSGFENVNFFDVNGGVSIGGGDEMTLESQNNYITNCHFRNYATVSKSYNPAISLGGVGNRVSSTKIEDGPHNAIMYSGNDQVMEFIEITDVVKEASDQSAIYTGRDMLQRGSVIRNCYFHDIPNGHGNPNSGIYLDDLTAGIDIIDNTFENVGWGIFVNGGRDNFMIGNVFINCKDGIIANDWGYTGVKNMNTHGYGSIANSTNMAPTLVPWNDPNSVYGKYEHMWCYRDDNPAHSKYNTVIGNTFIEGKDSRGLMFYMSRAVQANHDKVIQDWYFEKGNTTR